MEKYSRDGQDTDDYMAREHCMLDTQGYKHILRLYLLLFHGKNGCTHAPRCYVICTLPVLSSVPWQIVRFNRITRCIVLFFCSPGNVYMF